MKITQETINNAKEAMQESGLLEYLRRKEHLNFKIGDILVQKDREGDDWVINKDDNGLPHKYMYVYEEDGHGVISLIDENGELDYDMSVLADCIDEETTFEVDPEYVDHMLLFPNVPFNPHERANEVKAQFAEITKHNRKYVTVMNGDIENRNKILSQLKPKQIIHISRHHSIKGRDNDLKEFVDNMAHEVVKTRRVRMSKEQQGIYYPGKKYSKKNPHYYYTVKLKAVNPNCRSYHAMNRVNSLDTYSEYVISFGGLKSYEQKI